MKYLLPLLPVLFLFTACEDDNSGPTDPPSEPVITNFGGLLLTDANGNPLGGDPTDWQSTDTWTDAETSLFSDGFSEDCVLNDELVIAAYPNPATNPIAFYHGAPDNSEVQIRIIDRNYQLLYEQDEVPANFQLNTDDLPKNDTLRVLYKLLGPDCELRGHGDILIQ